MVKRVGGGQCDKRGGWHNGKKKGVDNSRQVGDRKGQRKAIGRGTAQWEERGGGHNARWLGGKWQGKRGWWTTWVVDGFWQRRQTTEYDIGKGDDKGDQECSVGALEVAGCSPWWQGRMAKLEVAGGGIGIILPSFFLCMCGCMQGQWIPLKLGSSD